MLSLGVDQIIGVFVQMGLRPTRGAGSFPLTAAGWRPMPLVLIALFHIFMSPVSK